MSEKNPTAAADESGAKKHTAGAFDIRNVIGALIGLYGVILLVTGLVAGSEPAHDGTLADGSRADDVGANLWVGAGMVVFAVAFLAWAYLKPTVVDEDAVEAARAEGHHPGH